MTIKEELEMQVLTLKAVKAAMKGQIGEMGMDTYTLKTLIKSTDNLIDIYEERISRIRRYDA